MSTLYNYDIGKINFWETQQDRVETGNDVYKLLIHVAVSQWHALSVYVALTVACSDTYMVAI